VGLSSGAQSVHVVDDVRYSFVVKSVFVH